MPTVTANSFTGDNNTDALLNANRWGTTTLTFSFPDSSSDYEAQYNTNDPNAQTEPDLGFAAFNAEQKADARRVMDMYESVSNLALTENGPATDGMADLRLAITSFRTFPAYAFGPSVGTQGGDAWFKSTTLGSDPGVGSWAYHTLIHEIGHALGLEHGHEGGPAGPMDPDKDSMEYSVMTYRSYAGAPSDFYRNETFGYAQTLMMYDIAAIQHMYGANFNHLSSNTVYSWNPDSGNMFINGGTSNVYNPAPGANRIFMTLWDGGGVDTYDFSNYSTSVTADLRPGEWTTTSAAQLANLGNGNIARGNIANALLYQGDTRSLIENANGGSANDVLVGNQAVNRLDGGAGVDVLAGGLGGDALYGGTGLDEANYFEASSGVNLDLDTGGTLGEALGDTFDSVENAHGSAHADKISGTSGNNVLRGRGGNDELNGEAGADELHGGAGNDKFHGGDDPDDIDTVSYEDATSGVVVNLSTTVTQVDGVNIAVLKAQDGQGGEDTFLASNALNGSSIEAILGSAHNDRVIAAEYGAIIAGLAGADYLLGLGGNDLLEGGAGIDTLKGGGGEDIASYIDDAQRAAGGAGVVVNLATGVATDGSGAQDSLDDIEHVVGSAFNDQLTGDSGNNVLDGGDGDDTLDGGTDNDFMDGGKGNDIYVVNVVDDVVTEAAEVGIDLIKVSFNYSLETLGNVEDLHLTAGLNGTGNGANNRIIGNSAANTLNGLAGADTFWGFLGNDTYHFDNAGDALGVTSPYVGVMAAGEALNGGADQILIHTANFTNGYDFTLSAAWGLQVENAILQDDVRAINLAGNTLANLLVGNAHGQKLEGLGGNDTLNGGIGGGDDYFGGGGDDTAIITGRTTWSNTAHDDVVMDTGSDHLVVDYSQMDGNNEVTMNGPASADASGFTNNVYVDGSHRITFSGVEHLTITTGAGHDVVHGVGTKGKIQTHGGNDIIRSGAGAGRDRIDGGDGVDGVTVDWSDVGLEAIELNLNDLIAALMGTGDTERYLVLIEYLETFIAGAGNDIITLHTDGSFSDNVDTGAGNDTVTTFSNTTWSNTAHDGIIMGAGFDDLIVDYSETDGNNEVALGAATNDGQGYSNVMYIDGSHRLTFSGVDRLTIFGGAGQDDFTGISTAGGLDRIDGGANFDKLTADWSDLGAGEHLLLNINNSVAAAMGAGATERYIKNIEQLVNFKSGAGNDVLVLSTNAGISETIATNGGNDAVFLYGGTTWSNTAHDGITMGPGADDHLVIDYHLLDGNNEVALGVANADADGWSGPVYIDGSHRVSFAGVDRLTLTTGDGWDDITSISDNDLITTNAGDDHVKSAAGEGRDRFDGGGGTDTATADWSDLTSLQAVNLDLNNALGVTIGTGANERYLRGFERLVGFVSGDGNDVIKLSTNGGLSDDVTTGAGNDTLTVFGATTWSNTAHDAAHLGIGIDHLIVDYSQMDGNNEVEMAAAGADGAGFSNNIFVDGAHRISFTGVDNLSVTSGAGNDFIHGVGNNGVISTLAGNDKIVSAAGAGRDRIDGGADTDSASGDWSDMGAAQGVSLNLNLSEAVTFGTGGSLRYLRNIEYLSGFVFGAGNDVIELSTNGGLADDVTTGDGDDTLTLHGGTNWAVTAHDAISMGAGSDHLVVDYSQMDGNNEVGMGAASEDEGGFSNLIYVDGSHRITLSGVQHLSITTGAGQDSIHGIGTDGVIATNGGNDFVASGIGAGRDRIDGGEGADGVSADWSDVGTQAVNVNLNNATAVLLGSGATERYLKNVEYLAGFTTGAGNDSITLSTDGSFGDDVTTGAGDDTVRVFSNSTWSNTAHDAVAMGVGFDDLIVDYSEADGNNEVGFGSWGADAGGFSNIMYIDGSHRLTFSGVDRLTVLGGAGNDVLVGISTVGGIDRLDGGGGYDQVIANWSDLGATEHLSLDMNKVTAALLGVGTAQRYIRNIEQLLDFQSGAGNDIIVLSRNSGIGENVATNAGNDTVSAFGGTAWSNTAHDGIAMGLGSDHLIVDYSAMDGNNEVVIHAPALGADGHSGTVLADGSTVISFSGVDRFTITAGAGLDSITTGAGADIIDGRSGADFMAGGDGSDTYHVDNASDLVSEGLTGDVDRVIVTLSWALAAGSQVELIETANALATTAIDLTGNEFVNSLTGNRGANVLDGGGAADRLTGGDGTDTYKVDHGRDLVTEGLTGDNDLVIASVSYRLAAAAQIERMQTADAAATQAINLTGNGIVNSLTGNEGANILNGGGAGDAMAGLGGDDTYIVDDIADTIAEGFAKGYDAVISVIDHVLAANVDSLRLRGDARVGTGNAVDNLIVGTVGDDTLKGMAGKDVLNGGNGEDVAEGGIGDDALFGGAGGDELKGEDGADRLFGQSEIDTLFGGIGGDRLDGGLANDILNGEAGLDTLIGGQGRDALTGGADADTFVFDDGDTSSLRAQADSITDFSRAAGDKIHLRAVDAKEGTPDVDENFAFLGTGAFTGAAGQLRYEIVSGTTYVLGDTDGDKAADFFIRIDGSVPLAATDFVL